MAGLVHGMGMFETLLGGAARGGWDGAAKAEVSNIGVENRE